MMNMTAREGGSAEPFCEQMWKCRTQRKLKFGQGRMNSLYSLYVKFEDMQEEGLMQRSRDRNSSSTVHPCSDTSTTHSSSKSQSLTAHWEVADQIPYQGNQLHHRRQ